MGYNRFAKAAARFLVIRSDIASGMYGAPTLIERLKKLEDQDIEVPSLIYALLELQMKHRQFWNSL